VFQAFLLLASSADRCRTDRKTPFGFRCSPIADRRVDAALACASVA
jgi:hypothetical protein